MSKVSLTHSLCGAVLCQGLSTMPSLSAKAKSWTLTSVPIIGAPMAGVAFAELCAAVANAGGLGFIAGGYTFDSLTDEIEKAKSLLKPELQQHKNTLAFGVGFIVWATPYDVFEKIASLQPKAIWLFTQLDRHTEIIQLIRHRSPKTKIIVQVGDVSEALQSVENGADYIALQGNDAGGHKKYNNASLLSLIPETADTFKNKNIDVPLIAAGGIVNAKQVASCFLLGAQAVVLGTALLVSPEARIKDSQQTFLLSSNDGGKSTVQTRAFDKLRKQDDLWEKDYTGRCLVNNSSGEGEKTDQDIEGFNTATKNGDVSGMVTWSGTSIGLVKKRRSATEIVEDLWRETSKIKIDVE